jgi:hypothetical protein
MIIKGLHISLAILVYFSSIGVTLNKHYCKGVLQRVALFVDNHECTGACSKSSTVDYTLLGIKDVFQEELPPCCAKALEKNNPQDEEKKNCCEEEVEYVQVEVQSEINNSEFQSLKKVLPVILFFYLQDHTYGSSLFTSSPQWTFLHFDPPIMDTDLSILFQSFLI